MLINFDEQDLVDRMTDEDIICILRSFITQNKYRVEKACLPFIKSKLGCYDLEFLKELLDAEIPTPPKEDVDAHKNEGIKLLKNIRPEDLQERIEILEKRFEEVSKLIINIAKLLSGSPLTVPSIKDRVPAGQL